MGQTVLIERTDETFNCETGEIYSSVRSTTSYRTKETDVTDEYIKVSRYLHTIFAYHNIPLNLIGISLCIAQRMEFKTNIVYLLKEDKEEIGEMLGFGKRYRANGQPDTNTVDKLLRDCKKYDIIRPTKTRGKYEVNGYLFSYGKSVDTRNIQAHFDFDKNILVTSADMKHRITGETVRKAVSNKKAKQIPGQMSLADLLEDKEGEHGNTEN